MTTSRRGGKSIPARRSRWRASPPRSWAEHSMPSAMDPNALAVQNIIDGIGEVLDRLFPAPEERAKAERARHEIARLPALKQIDLAGDCALFVAGWRPTIGWVCALA